MKQPILITLLLATTSVFVSNIAWAEPVFTVNSVLDQPDDLTMPGTCHTAAGTCTLRAAIMQANRSSGAGATIILPAGAPYVLTIPAAGANGEENGDLNLTNPASGNPFVSIVGDGASTTIIDANQIDRAFTVSGNRSASISGVTIRNGYTSGGGAGILNSGSLAVSHCTLSQNSSNDGGGIFNVGSLGVSDSTFSQNDGDGIYNSGGMIVERSTFSMNYSAFGDSGGGIFNLGTSTVSNSAFYGNIADFGNGGGIGNQGNLTVSDTTFSANYAPNGGAIFNTGIIGFAGTTTIVRSTLSGNRADNGGGVWNGSNLVVVNSTISQNDADNDGGGIYNTVGETLTAANANVYSTSIVFNGADADADPNGGSGGGVFNNDASGSVFNLRNTLVAGNIVSGAPVYDDCTGTLHSYGRNLFWNLPGCTVVIASGGWGYLFNLNTFGPLQNNGGPTQTVALLPGNRAIDFGDPVSGCIDYNSQPIPTDQRGYARVVGTHCDVGAYEYSDTIFKDGFQ